MKKLVLAVMLLAAASACAAGKAGDYAYSAHSCGKVLEAARDREQSEKAETFWYTIGWWMQGYVAAYNRLTPGTFSILGDRDHERAMLWVNAWCEKNPLEDLSSAMQALTTELHPGRHKTKQEAAR
jgi:hypothetical protein